MSVTISAPPLSAANDNVTVPPNGPFALFLDVDGTLLDLADWPGAVETPTGLVAILRKIERRLEGALALISGRTIEELDRLFEPLRLRASGVHGAEVRFDPDKAPGPAPGAVALPESLWTAVSETLREFPGTFAENKHYSFAIHYRLAPDAEGPLRERIMKLVEREPQTDIQVMDAHCALELKVPGFDKGRAIESFLATPPFRGRTPIFVGDDKTDEAGFAVVSALGGYAYSVGRRRPGAIDAFERPSAVREWIKNFADHGGGA